MSRYNDELKLKLALQTAHELRTCPGADILYAESIDENLQKHLSFCSICRESRAMQLEEKNAWQSLHNKLSEITIRPASGTAKQSGQVWTLQKSLGAWMENGRYCQPPAVLLLEQSVNSATWKVAQLYEDKRLMGSGDVSLDDRFGFAEGWNCYEMKGNRFDKFLGIVKPDELRQVIAASVAAIEPVPEDSILSFFRQMEIEVGENVAVVVYESPVIESFLEGIFGSVADVYNKLSKFKLPEYADSLIDLLSGASDPHGISPVVASTSVPLLVNTVIKQMDGGITIKTIGAVVTDDNWEDGDYYVAGKLNVIQNEELFLVASLSLNGKIISECQSKVEKDSPYFDIVFSSVAKDDCIIENIKFILVRP